MGYNGSVAAQGPGWCRKYPCKNPRFNCRPCLRSKKKLYEIHKHHNLLSEAFQGQLHRESFIVSGCVMLEEPSNSSLPEHSLEHSGKWDKILGTGF